MSRVSLIMAYYENPQMLAHQYQHLASLDVKSEIDIVIVDDGSPKHPAIDVPRPEGLNLRLYRMVDDVRWNQDACRNLGAKVAFCQWLLLTDIDHVVPLVTWQRIMFQPLDERRVYMFSRVEAPHMQPFRDVRGQHKPHPNSWLMTAEMYEKVGGYDERFAGWYGTDGDFKERVLRHANITLLKEPLVVYSRSVIPDASTTAYLRKTSEDRINIDRIKRSRGTNYTTIRGRFACHQVYP